MKKYEVGSLSRPYIGLEIGCIEMELRRQTLIDTYTRIRLVALSKGVQGRK